MSRINSSMARANQPHGNLVMHNSYIMQPSLRASNQFTVTGGDQEEIMSITKNGMVLYGIIRVGPVTGWNFVYQGYRVSFPERPNFIFRMIARLMGIKLTYVNLLDYDDKAPHIISAEIVPVKNGVILSDDNLNVPGTDVAIKARVRFDDNQKVCLPPVLVLYWNDKESRIITEDSNSREICFSPKLRQFLDEAASKLVNIAGD